MLKRIGRLVVALSLIAAAPPPISNGDTVYDLMGDKVGTIESVTADAAVLSTGTTKVTLGLKSFWQQGGKLRLGMSREALEAANAKVQSQGDNDVRQLLLAGASIYDSEGAVAATVEKVEGDRITLKVGTIQAVFPISAFSKGDKGASIPGTAADFATRLKAQLPAPAPAPQPSASQSPKN